MALFEGNTFQLLLGTLAVILFYWLWTKSRRSYSKYNIPPFPVRPWPFVGHIFMLFGNIRGKLKEWRKTGGDIYSLDLAGQLNIFVNDFKKNLMAEKIQAEVAVVLEKLAELKGQPEYVHNLFTIAVGNIISSVAVGQRFDYDDSYFLQLIKALRIAVKYISRMRFLKPVHQLYLLPGDMFAAKKWTQASKQINDIYCKRFIDKYKNEFNENEEPENFISAYILEMKTLKDKGIQTNLDEANLVSIIKTLFFAGIDVTSTTLLWCLLYVLHYPEVQEKVYQEIEAVVGTERTPNMNDKPKLVYLNAVIMEIQRRASIFPNGLTREVSATFEYGGFTFPKGCVVWPILDSVLHDKN